MCLGWVLAAAMNLVVLYGLYGVTHGHNLSPAVNAFYAAVHRNVWAVGLGWVIFACSTGHGGTARIMTASIIQTYVLYVHRTSIMYRQL